MQGLLERGAGVFELVGGLLDLACRRIERAAEHYGRDGGHDGAYGGADDRAGDADARGKQQRDHGRHGARSELRNRDLVKDGALGRSCLICARGGVSVVVTRTVGHRASFPVEV